MVEIIICKNAAWLDKAVALFVQSAAANIENHGSFSVSLAGGSTPAPLYAALAKPEIREEIAWDKVHLFWGDERHVQPDDAQSNFRMVKEKLLDKISIPEENVHRVQAETDVRLAAFTYEESLRQFFPGDWPRFDLVLLGMGEDGHTASLFPRSAALNQESRWFVANYAPDKKAWRLTLTANAINTAGMILVLVRGKTKATRLKDVLLGIEDPWTMPIQAIQPMDGTMTWLVDEGAGSQLPEDISSRLGC